MSINSVGSFYAQNYDVQNRSRSARGKSAIADFMGNMQSRSVSSDNANCTGVASVDDKSSLTDSKMDYQRIISERKNEIYEKLKNGDTEQSFQIGGNSFTEKEWDKLLSEVDDITEEMREAMREEHQKRFAETVEEKSVKQTENMDSTDALSKLFDTENTDIMDFSNNTSKGISAREYSAEELQEVIDKEVQSNQYKKKSLYEMLMDSCPEGTNATFRFAGESKIYSFYEYIEELERRSGKLTVDSTPEISNTRRTEIKVSNFKEYETTNYKVVPCNDGAYSYFNIYKNGESAGAFFYSDICIKRDSITGTEVLLSEHGTGAGMYNVIPMDEELKQALKGAMGVDELPTEELSGYSIKSHQGTGIQYVMKNGAEGRGGTPLLRSQRDIEKYNELTQTYMDKYPNLVTSQGMAEMYASFEICGCVHRTETGIMKVFCDSISYNDNNDYKKNWAAKYDDATWDLLYEWLEEHQNRVNDFDKFQSWADILDEIGGTCERIWSDEELDQGYLNN